MPGQGFARDICGGHCRSINVTDDRKLRDGECQDLKVMSKPLLRRLHQRAMEWRADRKYFGALGAAFVGKLHGTLYGREVARNYDLLRRIDVGRFADFSLSGIGTDGTYCVRAHA